MFTGVSGGGICGGGDPLLRRAVVSDAAAIAVHEQQLFGSDAWSANLVLSELNGKHREYWVFELAGELIAYAGVLVLGGEADVQTIAVAKEHRGRGLGRLLLRKLCERAVLAGAQTAFLEVRADNPAALKLYEKQGFRQIAVRPKYYQPDGVDAIIMRAALAAHNQIGAEYGDS